MAARKIPKEPTPSLRFDGYTPPEKQIRQASTAMLNWVGYHLAFSECEKNMENCVQHLHIWVQKTGASFFLMPAVLEKWREIVVDQRIPDMLEKYVIWLKKEKLLLKK